MKRNMKVSRDFSLGVQYLLDQWVPPRIRDSRWFMYVPMKLLFKGAAGDVMNFKDKVFTMNSRQFSKLYERTASTEDLQGETDLNEACTKAILRAIKGKKVLEVGCGRGYLARLLAKNNTVTACDIVINPDLQKNKDKIKYVEANIEKLPFKDNSFEVVVSTHTLEHVQNLSLALAELRRVTKKELIIVVPRQRPYKYNFNLHTQFFPYKWSIEAAFGTGRQTTIKDLGDWLYREKR